MLTPEQMKNQTKPAVNNSLPLDKLEEKLDKALAKETPETLSNWLKEKRGKSGPPDAKRSLGDVFADKEQLADFIQRNIPFCVKPKKKAKTTYVGVFTSSNAMKIVIEELTDRLWEKLS
jgi:hypothetical protein